MINNVLIQRRNHGIRKQYNGRKPTVRYDSTRELIEINEHPVKLWLKNARNVSDEGDNFVSYIYKPSSNKDRRLETDDIIQFLDGDEHQWQLRVAYTVRGLSPAPHRVIGILVKNSSREYK